MRDRENHVSWKVNDFLQNLRLKDSHEKKAKRERRENRKNASKNRGDWKDSAWASDERARAKYTRRKKRKKKVKGDRVRVQ